LLAGSLSCRVEHLQSPSEPVKSINGTWQIIDATQNGTDLMSRFDFSKFRITFTDSTYAIDSLLPFMVNTAGKWAFNDPQYPFSITLTATDSAAVSSPLTFPVVGGVRNMILTFSPGCKANTYQYTLRRSNQ
jgi:hypothetical protein